MKILAVIGFVLLAAFLYSLMRYCYRCPVCSRWLLRLDYRRQNDKGATWKICHGCGNMFFEGGRGLRNYGINRR